MARNNRKIDRQVKHDEIAAAAARLFIERGYEATSMAMIAASVGVAPNTLYWYYKSKDELLVDALNRLVAAGFAAFAGLHEQPLGKQLLWAFQQFARVSDLISTVHALAARSEVVGKWHDQFHAALEGILIQKLAERGMAAAQARMMATVGTFVIEGLLSHPHSQRQRQAVVAWLAGMESPKRARKDSASGK